MKVSILKDEPWLRTPRRQTEGSAGFDLRAAMMTMLEPGTTVVVPTGLRMAIEGGHGEIRPRSSLSKMGIDVALGTIDSDYRGPVGVIVSNRGDGPLCIKIGDRIAQIVFVADPPVEVVEVDSLDETARAEGGFGSTGRD